MNDPQTIRLHPHAEERLVLRGATAEEVVNTVAIGEQFPANLGRTGFRRNFPYNALWKDKHYGTKQVEVIAVRENGWLVLTVIVKYF